MLLAFAFENLSLDFTEPTGTLIHLGIAALFFTLGFWLGKKRGYKIRVRETEI